MLLDDLAGGREVAQLQPRHRRRDRAEQGGGREQGGRRVGWVCWAR